MELQRACFSSSSSTQPPKNDEDSQTPADKESAFPEEDVSSQQASKQAHDNKQVDTDMLWRHWIKQLRSPPNILTSLRIFSAPILSYLIVTEQYEYALIGCFAAGISDVVDGYLAKNYRMSTVLGTYLDPFADKILINVLSISLWYADILPTPLVALWMTRDAVLVLATYWYTSSQTRPGAFVMDPVTVPLQVEPTGISKVNTAFQFLTISVGLIQPVYAIPELTLPALW